MTVACLAPTRPIPTTSSSSTSPRTSCQIIDTSTTSATYHPNLSSRTRLRSSGTARRTTPAHGGHPPGSTAAGGRSAVALCVIGTRSHPTPQRCPGESHVATRKMAGATSTELYNPASSYYNQLSATHAVADTTSLWSCWQSSSGSQPGDRRFEPDLGYAVHTAVALMARGRRPFTPD